MARTPFGQPVSADPMTELAQVAGNEAASRLMAMLEDRLPTAEPLDEKMVSGVTSYDIPTPAGLAKKVKPKKQKKPKTEEEWWEANKEAEALLSKKLTKHKKGNAWWSPPKNVTVNRALMGMNLWTFGYRMGYRSDLGGIIVAPHWNSTRDSQIGVMMPNGFHLIDVDMAQALIDLVNRQPSIEDGVRKSLDALESKEKAKIPGAIKNKLIKDAIKVAKRRWGARGEAPRMFWSFDGSKPRKLGMWEDEEWMGEPLDLDDGVVEPIEEARGRVWTTSGALVYRYDGEPMGQKQLKMLDRYMSRWADGGERAGPSMLPKNKRWKFDGIRAKGRDRFEVSFVTDAPDDGRTLHDIDSEIAGSDGLGGMLWDFATNDVASKDLQKHLYAGYVQADDHMLPLRRVDGSIDRTFVGEDVVPWDDEPLEEARRRGREPAKPGFFGPRHKAALAKGYLDVGLVDRRNAKGMSIYRVGESLAWAMKKGVAFIRDPENILGTEVRWSLDELAKHVKGAIADHWAEEVGLAGERDDWETHDKYGDMEKMARAATVRITPVTGKTGAGYKVVMSPSREQIESKFAMPTSVR